MIDLVFGNLNFGKIYDMHGVPKLTKKKYLVLTRK
jgi:hypothetical protein